MLGRSHLISGVVAGLAVSALVEPPPILVPIIVAVAAYSALVPDVDHPSAPAARCLGPLSWLLCLVVRWASARTVGVQHRGMSHSLLFAAVWGVLVGGSAAAVLPVPVAAWIGAAAALGAVTHIAGDVLTVSGCRYVLWPSRTQVRVPYPLRFRTGGTAERMLVVGLVAAGVVLVPGVLR